MKVKVPTENKLCIMAIYASLTKAACFLRYGGWNSTVAVAKGESQMGRLIASTVSMPRLSEVVPLPLAEMELGEAYVSVIVTGIEPDVSFKVDLWVDVGGSIWATLIGHRRERFTAEPASLLIASRTFESTTKWKEGKMLSIHTGCIITRICRKDNKVTDTEVNGSL